MATSSKSDDEWEKIETISLNNQGQPNNEDDQVKETSFINSIPEVVVVSPTERNLYGIKAETPIFDSNGEGLRAQDSRRTSAEISLNGHSLTPQSDTRSYRERLKDRINTVKEKAGVTVTLSSQKYARTNVKSSKLAALDRITDILLKEEADVRDALERRYKSKENRREEILSNKRKSVGEMKNAHENESVSYVAALEFFTKVWKSSEDISSAESRINSPLATKKSDSENALYEIDDNTKISAADYLGLKDTLKDPAEFKTAHLIDKDSFYNKSKETLFRPCSKEVPIEERLSRDGVRRDLREEGLFVPRYPKVAKKNLNKLFRRLVAEKSNKWFREDDGDLIQCPFPLESVAYHPFCDEETDDLSDLVKLEPALLFGYEETDARTMCIDPNACYILELKCIRISFSHHPLFSREHVVAQQLLQLYEQYHHRISVNVTRKLASRLKALRTAHDNLKKVVETEADKERLSIQKERLKRYKMEIKEVRKQRMLEGKNDNSLLVKLLSTWKDLKRIRSQQTYTSTNMKLQILKSDEFMPTEDWQTEIKRQVEEIAEETAEETNEISRSEDSKSDSYTTIKEVTDEKRKLNLSEIQKRVIEEVSESIPAPGEPFFTVTLTEQEITPDHELTNALEIQRRSLMSRSRVWFRIFYNGHEVCKSTPQPLERQFTVTFNQKFSIRLQEWPETLSVQMFCDWAPSKGIFNEHPLVEVFIPLPSKGATLDNVSVENYEFSSTDEVGSGVRHSGVGSAVPFKLFPDSDSTLCLYTTASIMYQIGWGTNNEHVLSPPEYFFEKLNFRRARIENRLNLPSDIRKLKEWMKSAYLDPNDPSNVTLFELLKKADGNINDSKKYFNVYSAQKSFDFCSEEELTSDFRLKLLSLRARGELEFKNLKAIPLREWEVPKDIFKSYEKRISNPELPFDTISLGQLEIHRAWGQHSLNMLYDQILKQCRLFQQHRNIQDVIHEDKVPDIGTLGLTFMKLLQPNRPLRPRRKGRKRIPVQGLTGQEVKVIVNVVRAFEVPIRKDVDTLNEDNISYVPVRPFIEVTFKGQTKRTVTADGPNPTWNHDLCFSVIGPNEGTFQARNMNLFNDSLHIHLFDEIIVDILEDDRIRDTTIHQRLERNWLGSLRIPFSTLYFNHQVEGTFQLYSPPSLLGYDRQTSLASSDHSYLRNSTFLNLFIIVQPPLSPPDRIMENLESNEPLFLEQHLELWSKEVAKEVPHRPFKTLVTDVSGKSVCVTRFFRPIDPPVIYEDETTTAEMIARFVSLIPVSTSGALLFGHFNVWLTCDQTIKLLLGEREDHAILLCCFFMKLGLKSWLLVGNGIPHGHSTYVLTRHEESLTTPIYSIWDPVAGLKYSSMDSFSPLHKVHCLINDENIWVNIQNEELVRRTNFDIGHRSDWWPAFGRNISTPMTSVQPDSIEYTVTSRTDVHLLQDKIEKYLRDSIMKWRPTSRTSWNRYCIATLRKLLPVMEREACGLKPHGTTDHFTELQHILGSYKICGFPTSQPFTDIKAIIDAVKSTGVHINESPDVEFALAVYIHPYPNDVLCVWVYAASLVARR